MNGHVYIISLAPYGLAKANRPFGEYLVPPAPKGGYAKYRVNDATDWRDMGEKRYIPLVISARALAEDLIKDVADHGLFVIGGDEPTEEQLADARVKRDVYLRRQVDEADADYRQHGNRSLISLHAKAAAEVLGMKREWLAEAVDMIACPNCETRISPMVAQCTTCRAIVNYEKAREFGLLTPEQELNAVKMGRLPSLFSDEIGETNRVAVGSANGAVRATKQAKG